MKEIRIRGVELGRRGEKGGGGRGRGEGEGEGGRGEEGEIGNAM